MQRIESPSTPHAFPQNFQRSLTLPLRMALVNARSITNKTFVLKDIVKTKELDFLFMNETWQRNMENASLKEICPKDYTFISLPRLSGCGGGHVFCRTVNVLFPLLNCKPFDCKLVIQIPFIVF